MSSILREIAQLSNPDHLDYDPEDILPDFRESDSDQEENAASAGRQHYVQVSESQLKKRNEAPLKDAKYRGKATNRRDLFDDPENISVSSQQTEDDSEGDEDSDMEQERSKDNISEKADESSHDSSESSDVSGDEKDGDDQDNQETRRDKVRTLLAQETRSLAEQISESAQADADKGRDIRTQQRFYDTLLDVRIRFQKALIALNSLPQGTTVENYTTSDISETLNAAKSQAFALFAQSLDLRTQLLPNSSTQPLSLKRKFDEISMTDLVNTSKSINQAYQSHRDETLTKWSDKVKTASGLPVNKKFKALNQSITNQLQSNLTDKPRLLVRTRTKRATFTVLGGTNTPLVDSKNPTVVIDADIFDDLDFYHPLLEDLVERKAVDLPVETWSKQGGGKGTKNFKDTKASKGRKVRYHEHEKIQNFMAPVEAGSWHDEQIDELFAGLLGRQIRIEENEGEDMDDEVVDLKDGLRIFG